MKLPSAMLIADEKKKKKKKGNFDGWAKTSKLNSVSYVINIYNMIFFNNYYYKNIGDTKLA